MEPRKVLLIGLLLGGLFGYGIYSNHPPSSSGTSIPTLTPTSVIAAWIGRPLPPWKPIPSRNWINTPKPIPPSVLRNRVSLVEFFRIDCPHCQEAAPLMVAIAKRYVPRGLNLVTFQTPGDYRDPSNEENDWGAVKAWCASKGITYPVGFDFASLYFQKKLRGTNYPTLVLLDRTGTVTWGETGHDADKGLDLAAELERRFPDPGTPAQQAHAVGTWLAGVPEYQGADPQQLADEIDKRMQASRAA